MKVTPVSRTLADLFRGSFLKIPRFQREYDWDRENLTDFWLDLKDRTSTDYFMGSVVVFTDRKEKNLLSLVDGQQRLTTITIMLAVLRDALDEIGETALADGLHELIETKDIDNKSRFILEHVPTDHFFQVSIQSRRTSPSQSPVSDQQVRFQQAHRYLTSAFRASLRDRKIDGEKKETVEYIRHLRNALMDMHFISVELDDEDDAYLIFETLNTRGKDLRVSDLLKNHFMRLIPAK